MFFAGFCPSGIRPAPAAHAKAFDQTATAGLAAQGRDVRASQRRSLQRPMSATKLLKRYSMAYRRSRLEHRSDVSSVKEVDQLAHCHRGPTLRLLQSGVPTKPDDGQHVGCGLASLFRRQLSDLTERHSLFRGASSATVRPVITYSCFYSRLLNRDTTVLSQL